MEVILFFPQLLLLEEDGEVAQLVLVVQTAALEGQTETVTAQ
jgi:hypothetical protein